MKKLFVVACIIILITGCSGYVTKQDTGTIIGALTGGVLGNSVGKGSGKIVTTYLGTVIGATAGNGIGESFDKVDEMHARKICMRYQYINSRCKVCH
jgi:uncharacterized protein YcfJ